MHTCYAALVIQNICVETNLPGTGNGLCELKVVGLSDVVELGDDCGDNLDVRNKKRSKITMT